MPKQISYEELVQKEQELLKRPLTEEEKKELAATVKFISDHSGHEAAHAQMLLIFLVALFVSQILTNLWRKYHPKSFNLFTLVGLWWIPFFIAYYSGSHRFLFIWTCYSLLNGYILFKAFENPIQSSTPKLVYYWYARLYDVCYILVMIGYALFILSIFDIPMSIFGTSLDTEANIFDVGVNILFYGMYFGTLSRDFVDRLADRMATRMGYYSRTGFPSKHLREGTCGICSDSTRQGETVTLECRHVYHFDCIKGWCIIGKKDTCPYCKEKVDLRQFKNNPWETTQHAYLQLLDALRFIIVYNPIVFLLVHYVYKMFGLK